MIPRDPSLWDTYTSDSCSFPSLVSDAHVKKDGARKMFAIFFKKKANLTSMLNEKITNRTEKLYQ